MAKIFTDLHQVLPIFTNHDSEEGNGFRGICLSAYLSVCVLVCVAVHEYANSTSAHDTVLEHRFSPTQMPFTSWQYANE